MSILDIDHLMIKTGDLAAPGDRFAELGFTVTARSDMPGLANRLICFDAMIPGACNYIEIMQLTDPDAAPPPMPDVLDAPDGPVSTVTATSDADATAVALNAAGIRVPPPVSIRRDWPLDTGEVISPAFRVAIPLTGQTPFYWNACQHHTPQHYTRPEFIRHANHARQMIAVIALAPDPAAVAAAYRGPWAARLDGTDPVAVTAGPGRVALRIFSADRLVHACPGMVAGPHDRRLAGLVFATDDIDAAFARIDATDARPVRTAPGRFHVLPQHANGCLMIFEGPA